MTAAAALAASLAMQGCTQCADAMRGTSGAMQAAYARSILALIAGGVTVFAGALWLVFRNDR